MNDAIISPCNELEALLDIFVATDTAKLDWSNELSSTPNIVKAQYAKVLLQASIALLIVKTYPKPLR